jgi:hypothetical protein
MLFNMYYVLLHVIYLFFDFYYCLSMSISDPKPVNRADRDQMVCWLSGRNAQKLRFCAKVVTKYISWQVRLSRLREQGKIDPTKM